MDTKLPIDSRHNVRQQKLKKMVDQRIAAATKEQGTLIIFTGNGKGKTSAAMGTAIRALGHQLTVGIIQFIKGETDSGERQLLSNLGVFFYTMNTGFTWETQDRESDIIAANQTWQCAKILLADPRYDLIILDELTYMIAYHYLDLAAILDTIQQRPEHQTVIITGRGCHKKLLALADTVTEMRPVKHAFDQGISAQKGIDW